MISDKARLNDDVGDETTSAVGLGQKAIADDDDTGHDHGGDQAVVIPRHLGLRHCVWHLISVIIGTGIFVSPSGVLRGSGGSVPLALSLWVACGLFNVCGALTLAELSVLMRKSGGDFTFLLQSWGPLVAFIRLWVLVIMIGPAGTAVGGLVVAKYVLTPFLQCISPGNGHEVSVRLMAACCILLFVAINGTSVRLSTKIAGFFSATKVLSLFVIIISGFYYLSQGHTDHLRSNSAKKFDPTLLPTGILSGIWATSGWSIITSVTEEIIQPARNVPLSIVISMSTITTIYLLVNVAYLTLLSPEQIMSSEAVAADYGELALGHNWSWTIWLFVAMSAMGSFNSGVFKGARIVFAAAREGHFPEIFSMVSIRRRTPLPALILVFLSIIYLIESDVIVLISYLGFTDVVFETFTIAIVPYYRWKYPDMHRPYKVPLVIAIIYLLTLLFIASMSIYADPVRKSIGLAIAFIAVPVYFALVHPKYRVKRFDGISGRVTRFLQKILFCVHQEEKTF